MLVGTTEHASNAGTYQSQTPSLIVGMFTIAAGKQLELQHYTQAIVATSVLGIASSGEVEVYAILELWKIA